MNSNYLIRRVDRDSWLSLVPDYKDYNYRQAWGFGTASALRVGAVSEHVAIEAPKQGVVGLADVRIKKLPIIGGGIAYINGGPLVLKKDDFREDIFCGVVAALKEEYVSKRKLSLRIAPPISTDTWKNAVAAALSNMGFENNNQEKKTILLDLSLELDEIRRNMHQKWRNCLNKSERMDLELRVGKDLSIFQDFIPLFNALISKKGFSVDLDIDFYASVQEQSANYDNYVVSLAELEGVPVAGHVASILGNTSIYLLGAANDAGRKSNAAYLLQWHAINIAKSSGCRWYDLGGIDPKGNPGVYRFKQRMGGREVDISGPYEMRATGGRALLTKMGEKVYNSLKPYLIKHDFNYYSGT